MSLLPAVLNRIELLAAHSPDPAGARAALASFEQRQPAAFQRIAQSAAGLQYLIAVFSQSNFLTQEILDAPECLEQLLSDGDMHRVRTTDEFRARLYSQIDPAAAPDPLPFARFRRQQILRILIRDVLGFGTLPDVTAELSALADAIVETAYDRIHRDLVSRYGHPRSESGDPAHFAVIALGKLGGEELNYSSDIDLMFLYSANGFAANNTAILTNKEFFKRAANELTALLSAYTPEGMCYRVDLRLRPEGSLGEVCISLEGARNYYETRARDWELQMMIKARVAAGDRATGDALLTFIEPKIYSTTLDFSAIEALSVTRERINEKLARKKRSRGTRDLDIKLDRGGIRDIEFMVQCLQRLYGGADPWVRHGGTLLAIARLQDKGFLSEAEHGGLSEAYQFLRHLEHRLQFADDRQTHALPSDPAALELIARRMPGGGSADWLLTEARKHFAEVIEIYERVVHARAGSIPETSGPQSSNVVRALEQTAPLLSRSLAAAELQHGYRAFEHFLEKLSADESRLRRLNEDTALTARTLDLFEQSPYFAEELIRTPELIDVLGGAPAERAPHDARELRRWYRREMLRIQTASICESQPIFETLERTSALADTVIARAYEIAVTDVWGASPPERKLWVVALGRLGMREFDLASDADLVFVLADSEARRPGHMEQWTRVAGRLIDLVTAYTGDGVLFAVDTRLRPNGGDGPLVQTESAVKDYFTRTAEAWEGITYMKSRAVAGEPLSADLFLHHLQAIDWVRYGQSGRSRTDLRQMRQRLEKEQATIHPLKAGRGGYYDIDFLLMYLRLKTAGVFFRSLNTPERIEVLENMHILDKSEAGFLRDAATFYRALDHGLRVRSGHAEGKLPAAAQRAALGVLIKRWTSAPLDALDAVRDHTRELFDRLFG